MHHRKVLSPLTDDPRRIYKILRIGESATPTEVRLTLASRDLLAAWIRGRDVGHPCQYPRLRRYLQAVVELPPHRLVVLCGLSWDQARELQAACAQLLSPDPDPLPEEGAAWWADRLASRPLMAMGVAA